MSEFFDTGRGQKETKKTAAFNEKHPLIVDAKKKLQAKTKALSAPKQEQEQQQTDASNELKNPMGSPDKKQEEETSARYRMKNGKFF